MLHQIGSGVLGPVFRTYEPQRDRLVAVKAFRLDIVPRDVARLAEALRALAGIGPLDQAIVPALDAGLEGTTAYLAMEYVAAETLDVAMRHLAPAPLDRAIEILSHIATAIDAGWAAGRGYGSLHPRDVFVTIGTGEIRVTGFGVVPALESVGIKAPVRRPYAAPERVSGEPWGIRADVYSLGAIAHELLTRRRPAGSGEQDGVLTTGTTPEQRVSIRRVLSAALAERPPHRFASARAFVEALSAIAAGQPLGALPYGADQEGKKQKSESAPLLAVLESASAAELPPPPPPAETAPSFAAMPAEAADEFPSEAVEEPVSSMWPPPSAPEAAAPTEVRVSSGQLPPLPVAHETASPEQVISVMPYEAHRGEYVAPAPSFPWAAIVAVATAGLVLGGVVGYAVGLRRAPAPTAPPAAASVAAKPSTDTEVTVPREPVVAPVTEPPVQSAPRAAAPPAPPPKSKSRPAASTATTGAIDVVSRPAGARVFIDGRLIGTTPLRVPEVRPGTHALRLELAGHRSLPAKVDVKAGESASVKVSLEQIR